MQRSCVSGSSPHAYPFAKHGLIVGLLLALPFATAVSGQEGAGPLDRVLAEGHQVAQAAQADGALAEAMQSNQGEQPSSLPNGASSITETFGDWTVNCAVDGAQKACAMSQAQGNQQTGQQIFAIELYGTTNGNGSGILVLPFGLDVQTPVKLSVGEEALGEDASFTTCMPGGCVVPVSFSQTQLDALKRGTTASVIARSASAGGPEAEFTISLSGFTAAANRVDQLAR